MSLSKNNGVSPKVKVSAPRAAGKPPIIDAAAPPNRTERRESGGITGILPYALRAARVITAARLKRRTIPSSGISLTPQSCGSQHMSRILDMRIIQLFAAVIRSFAGWRSRYGGSPSIVVDRIGPLSMQRRLLDFGPVLRNREAMGYVLGYGAHCFELYSFRTWVVAFWTFIAAQHPNSALLGAVAVSVISSLLAMPASILGNEAAPRFGRHRALTVLMVVSAAVALAIGFSVRASPPLLLVLLLAYSFTVPSDSGALTSGMSLSAEPSRRGATMAMYTTLGFGLSALGTWGSSITLDLAGGPESSSGWLAALGLLAGSILLGPVALWWSRCTRSDK